ncbi:MAG: hypothetical protein Q8K02_00975 [Flavobacterium sp.]|nr:hypothetical protein [Flavobacterium sp.]
MKQKALTLFSIIGVIFICYKSYSLIKREIRARSYISNCQKVKVGMNLDEARKIMGDFKYQYWTQDEMSGEIIIKKDNEGNLLYSLEYDIVFGGSENPRIIFDPKTLNVTEVYCKE